MDSKDIPKPWKYRDKWLVWPETVLNNLDISDCDDTIGGICLEGKTLEQCINECTGDCAAGYLIELDDSNICVPMRTNKRPDMKKGTGIRRWEPAYRLRNKSIYSPILDKVKVSTFINTDIYPFPPPHSNAVFFNDILTIKDVMNGLTIGTGEAEIKGKDYIYMTSSADDNIQIISGGISTSKLMKYKPVLYGEPIQFAVPGTSLIATENPDVGFRAIIWKAGTGTFNDDDMAFRLIPAKDSKKSIGDIVTYDDIFEIKYISVLSAVVVNTDHGYLELRYHPLQQEKDHIFQFISKMIGYYCDGKECKSVPVRNIDSSGKYKGNIVVRSSSCFGRCKYISSTDDKLPIYRTSQPVSSKSNVLYIILGIILLAIPSIILLRIYLKKKSKL
jgi:hypothetical protein